jgi:cyclohexa-1,5-dienecarbonyl-CoA hydratase
LIHFDNSDGVAKIFLDHPPLNVINISLMIELEQRLQEVKNSDVNVIIIGATGKLFSAGVDVADHTEEKVDDMIKLFHKVIRSIWNLPQPVIAQVQGACLGGGMELALACDFVIASDNVKIGQPEVKVGVFPPIAALILPKLTTRQFALESVLLGETYSAQRFYELGLINSVVASDELENRVGTWVDNLKKLSRPVIQQAKKATLIGWNQNGLEAPLNQIEELYLNDLMKLDDAKEGLNAFMEKRPPEWKDQ